MTALTTAPLAPLLDRLLKEAEAPTAAQLTASLAQISPQERASLSASPDVSDCRRAGRPDRDPRG